MNFNFFLQTTHREIVEGGEGKGGGVGWLLTVISVLNSCKVKQTEVEESKHWSLDGFMSC